MKNYKNLKNQSGQLSIFFASTLLLLVTCMAFVINVGLFVKAKINLQNAVDAAAFSGASVQARQLSDIAYLNWELRNTYKEWMFKYYILGQLSQNKTRPENIAKLPGNTMDFRLDRFDNNEPFGDYFNVPSSCLHFAQAQFNICSLYTLPGLPRFSPLGIPGVDETQNEFLNVFTKEKSKDCTKRSDMNFKMVLAWSYGTEQFNAPIDVPQVASTRVGIWPKAFEIALRIRNLEKLVNTPPVEKICRGGADCTNIADLHQRAGQVLPLHERSVKAFYSAYRNLGNNDPSEGLKKSFILTEIPPRMVNSSPESSLSAVLIPESSVSKYYLDLRLHLVNFVIFFSLFSSGSGKLAGTGSEAQCSGIKSGLPVPGVPFAFDKNPEMITYYAVKGEADYWGLFNPFSTSAKLVAYAAAKPFGGRIGPMLMKITKNQPLVIYPRQSNGTVARSFSYITGMDPFNGGAHPLTGGEKFKLGYPIPLSNDFWVLDPSQAIGGNPKQERIHFAIPNLLYEINSAVNPDLQAGTSFPILIVKSSNDLAPPTEDPAGLYDKGQYNLLKSNISVASNTVDGLSIYQAINRVHSATLYEGLNYLIPSQKDSDSGNISSFPTVPYPLLNNGEFTSYKILAPLYGPDTWYPSMDKVQRVFEDYIQINKKSVDTYISSLQEVSKDIMAQSSALSAKGENSDVTNYVDAAKQIHNNPDGGLYQLQCDSMAGKFAAFFLGPALSGVNCPLNFQTSFFNYLERKKNETSGEFSNYFMGDYYPPVNRENLTGEAHYPSRTIMTAYGPGQLYHATTDGQLPHPLSKFNPSYPSLSGDRNYYSTKLVSLRTFLLGTTQSIIGAQGGSMTTYSEGSAQPPTDIEINQLLNPLENSGDGMLFRVNE